VDKYSLVTMVKILV